MDEYNSPETNQQFLKCDKVIVELMDVSNFLLPSLQKMAIKTADAFVLVYAVDDVESFDFICNLREEVIQLRGKHVPIIVAGNKADVDDRQIHPVVADCIVTIDHECPHIEVSAKEALELTTLFGILFQHPSLCRRVDRLKNILQSHRNSVSDKTNPSTQEESFKQPIAVDKRIKAKRSVSLPWRGVFKFFK